MKQNVLMIILVLFLLLPTKFIVKINADVDPIASEGYIATLSNSVDLTATEIVTECKCNGSKMVKSPDGLTNITCQCGNECKCKKSDTGSLPNEIGIAKEIDEFGDREVYYTYVFGAKWCGPCVLFDTKDVSTLESFGWKFNRKVWKENVNAVLVDVDESPKLFEKYAESGSQPIPFYVVVRNNKKVASHAGYLKSTDFIEFHNSSITKERNLRRGKTD